MIERHQRFCIWAGVGFAPIFAIGFALVAGFVPPPSPHASAATITRMFHDDRDRIRVGIWIACAAAPLLGFFVAAMSHQIKRIAGGDTPLATAQTVIGSCLILEFLFPQLVWQTAAYRSGRSADTVQLLNDLAWLPYVGIVGTAMVQMAIFAAVVLLDTREEPLIPRWVAYLNIWSALGVASGSLCVFTTTGPFAWNGLLAWYVLCVSFFSWMVTMTWAMLRASRRVDGTEAVRAPAGVPLAGVA